MAYEGRDMVSEIAEMWHMRQQRYGVSDGRDKKHETVEMWYAIQQ